ncbi:hypothetical protein M153_19660002324, partial [Pseudoloma neurophilia]
YNQLYGRDSTLNSLFCFCFLFFCVFLLSTIFFTLSTSIFKGKKNEKNPNPKNR